jgi:hypothetical protein
MSVLPVHRKSEFIGNSFASKLRPCIEKRLHGLGILLLDTRHRKYKGLATTGGIARYIK